MLLQWTVRADDAALNFHVWRHGADGAWVQLTTEPITEPSRVDSTGVAYQYVDATVEPGQTYTYRLAVFGLEQDAMTLDVGSLFIGVQIFLPMIQNAANGVGASSLDSVPVFLPTLQKGPRVRGLAPSAQADTAEVTDTRGQRGLKGQPISPLAGEQSGIQPPRSPLVPPLSASPNRAEQPMPSWVCNVFRTAQMWWPDTRENAQMNAWLARCASANAP